MKDSTTHQDIHTPHPINYICPECGSTDIGFEATADWNPSTGQFEHNDVYEGQSFCRDCDGDINARAVPCDSQGEPLPLWQAKTSFHGHDPALKHEYFASLAIARVLYPDLPEEAWESIQPKEAEWLNTLVTSVAGSNDPAEDDD